MGNATGADARSQRRRGIPCVAIRLRDGAAIVHRVQRVVIAGAGFGGIATAVALRRAMPPAELEIVLVDRRSDFVMGLRKTWAMLGIAPLGAGRRPLSHIADVKLVQGSIERIDPTRQAVVVDGQAITGDALVLALGARQHMDALPGLAEHGINAWDRDRAEDARAALDTLAGGQRLVVGIFGLPYSCPPAPFELALLARERLGAAVDITVVSPAPIALPVVGPIESAKVEAMLNQAGIRFLARHQSTAVRAGRIEFTDAPPEDFDVLLAVPVHRCPEVLAEAGLAQPGGWIKPDPRTLETDQPDVYAIGDCTVTMLANGLALPKAGIFAELQGEVVAARIAARIRGQEPTATFGGEGFCYVETGSGKAAKASGVFLADPVAVSISEPTTAALEDKREFERSRLASWFGE